jgi:hypothetical protein
MENGVVIAEGAVDEICDYYSKHVRPTIVELHG